MASNDIDVGIEGYLYEPEKADYLNINRSGNDSKLSLDTEGETINPFCDQETCTQPSDRQLWRVTPTSLAEPAIELMLHINNT